MDENRLIGDGDKLPWCIPEEYQQFLNTIRDQTVIWGRKTFQLFSQTPPAKRNLVLSRQEIQFKDAQVFHSLEEAFR